jgi:CRP-like cAMP-binding protein
MSELGLSALFPTLLADVRRTDLEVLDRTMGHRSLVAGEVVITEGEPLSSLFLLEEGQLAIRMQGATGKVYDVGHVGPGALLGDVSILDGGPATMTVVAATPARVRILTMDQFQVFTADRPSLGVALYHGLCRSLSERVRIASNKVEALATGTTKHERQGLLEAILDLFRKAP